jgi:hypothetical protein
LLPPRRREVGQRPDDPLIFSVELSIVTVRNNPDGSDVLALDSEGNQQRLDESRFSAQSREAPIGHVHQLGEPLVDADPVRAGRARHRAMPI